MPQITTSGYGSFKQPFETPENREKGPKSGGPIGLNHLRFSYPLRPDTIVLRGIDMTVSLCDHPRTTRG